MEAWVRSTLFNVSPYSRSNLGEGRAETKRVEQTHTTVQRSARITFSRPRLRTRPDMVTTSRSRRGLRLSPKIFRDRCRGRGFPPVIFWDRGRGRDFRPLYFWDQDRGRDLLLKIFETKDKTSLPLCNPKKLKKVSFLLKNQSNGKWNGSTLEKPK